MAAISTMIAAAGLIHQDQQVKKQQFDAKSQMKKAQRKQEKEIGEKAFQEKENETAQINTEKRDQAIKRQRKLRGEGRSGTILGGGAPQGSSSGGGKTVLGA